MIKKDPYWFMLRILIIILGISWSSQVFSKDCVILLHGLARSDSSFLIMQRTLKMQGYYVVNLGYPSREKLIKELVRDTIPDAIRACGKRRINFVTHSLGGIMVRTYLAFNELQNLDHVVMLAPPNKGSEIVDVTRKLFGFNWVNGPAGQELSTDKDSTPNILPPVSFSLGVVAGSMSFNPVYSNVINGPDDGKVSVSSTQVAGMSDHIVLPVTHTFMMNNPLVISQVKNYLKHGRFDKTLTFGNASWSLLSKVFRSYVAIR